MVQTEKAAPQDPPAKRGLNLKIEQPEIDRLEALVGKVRADRKLGLPAYALRRLNAHSVASLALEQGIAHLEQRYGAQGS